MQNSSTEEKKVQTQSLKIYLTGDIHCGKPSIYDAKKRICQYIMKLLENDKTNTIVIIPGDLTDNGYGKTNVLCCSCINTCSGESESDTFLNEIYTPLTRLTTTLMCHGNHDEGNSTFKYPMLEFIKKEYQATDEGYYYRIINGITIVCLGKYPSASAIKYFMSVILTTGNEYPYIVFFHYNLRGAWSEFWTDQEKKDFISFISDKKVMMVIQGHTHMTVQDTLLLGDRNIPLLIGSSEYSFLEINIEDYQVRINELLL